MSNQEPMWQGELADILKSGSPIMQQVLAKIRSVAPTITTVLLTGETGTGKGLIARVIHQLSNRKEMPFVAAHCGAVPDTLLESELFGHEKGSFTGAVRRKLGKFELARGGTLFLDEIGTITPSAQIKLLQVLQERTFQRVGGEKDIEADVRLIAATNSDLEQMLEAGTFRKDLYYRLNVFPVELPPLRERMEDLPGLVNLILRRLNRLYGGEIQGVHPDAMKGFAAYSWPGNIRELENVLERAFILESEDQLGPASLPQELQSFAEPVAAVPVGASMTLAAVRKAAVEETERRYLIEQLRSCEGRIAATAAAAGITTRQLHKLLTRYGISKDPFRRRKRG
jgi:transcriptional regulator with GAF, ATPase, and Fis domain